MSSAKEARKPKSPAEKVKALRHRLYEIMEYGPVGDRTSRLVNWSIILLIVISLFGIILASVPDLKARYGAVFTTIENIALVVFSVEFGIRVWIAVEHAPLRHLAPIRARMLFITSIAGLIDLAAVLPFWLAFLITPDLEILLVFRIARFLKLTRYSPGIRSLYDALYTERRALAGCFIILMGMTIFAATIMHSIEGTIQPDKFGTIPDAMWWAVVTLGTVGYGDIIPVTVLGRIVAAATIFCGLGMVALPIGIVATAFSNEIHRRDFVVTWGLVARVPLFSELSAAEIADIMTLLRAQQTEGGSIIVKRGEPAHSMYLIAAGEVEIRLAHKKIRLGAGHFFGEIAALRRTLRSATVTATKPTSLLVLDAADLEILMERNPQIAARIRNVARHRLGEDVTSARGDLLSKELEDEAIQHPELDEDFHRST
ncbi:voltage-gated potassium channel [Bradyrhizobium canariense]|uniref:Voltage-gated potassium channel n=2 Tax=Bradyrhizobium canariense TaxID=255045 RepID=A0A1H1SX35_9BRAD|nr:voltage-gated potassium channel [Bradyrhizobium canariense]